MLQKSDSRWHFWGIAGMLADLEAHTGNDEVVAGLGREVRTLLSDIINNISKGELRASFTALPEVGRLRAGDESYPRAG